GVYHCVQRVVRRAFLCGVDPLSGNSYDHRRTWIRDRLESLAGLFGVEIAAFAVMSNHVHVILRNRPDVVALWSDQEVARRWLALFPGRVGTKPDPTFALAALPGPTAEQALSTSPPTPAKRQATGPGTGRPAGAGGRDAECGSGADGDDPRAALHPLVVHACLGRADRPPGQPRGPLHRAVLRGPVQVAAAARRGSALGVQRLRRPQPDPCPARRPTGDQRADLRPRADHGPLSGDWFGACSSS